MGRLLALCGGAAAVLASSTVSAEASGALPEHLGICTWAVVPRPSSPSMQLRVVAAAKSLMDFVSCHCPVRRRSGSRT